jgi:signal transduction histidine kinase/CheY-like chemotaxis protein
MDSGEDLESWGSAKPARPGELLVLEPMLQRIVSRALGAGLASTCSLLAVFYAAALAFWTWRSVAGTDWIIGWCSVSLVLALGLGVRWRRQPPRRRAHLAGYLIGTWLGLGTTLHIILVPDPYVSIAYPLLAIAACVFYSDPRWILLTGVTQGALFASTIWAKGGSFDAADAWIMVVFAFFGVGFYTARNRVAYHFLSLVRRRRAAVEGALRAQKFESLGVLAGGVAHDFNNLLSVILAHAELIASGRQDTAQDRASAAAISGASEQAASLCAQLLTYVGGRPITVHPTDLNALIRDAYALLGAATSRRSELRFNLSEHIGTVIADPNQLRQLLLNLVSNAREAVGPNDGEITITTRPALVGTRVDPVGAAAVELETPHVCLTVADNGVGMSAAVLERMFDPFFSTKGAGRGLGLSAVQGIVSSASGLLEVESFPDAGSEFRIFLPEHDRRPVASTTPDTFQAYDRLHNTQRMLLVDDREDVLEATRILAVQLGYEVVTATSGEEAIRLVKDAERPFDCALIDAMMPGLDGIPTAAELRAMQPSLRIVVFSGVGEADLGRTGSTRSYDAFLCKPFTLSQLANALSPSEGETRYMLN